MINQQWRQTPITLEQWKAQCEASSYVRPTDRLSYHERQSVITCYIEGTSVFLGSYFLKGEQGILSNTGWCHS